MKFAVIDTRKQNARDVGTIASVHNSLAFAAVAAAGIYDGHSHVFPTVWRVAKQALVGMDVPWTEQDWAAPLSEGELAEMVRLIKEEHRRLVPARPRRTIPHNRRFIGADGRIMKKCPRCGEVKDASGFYQTLYNGWAGNCRACQSLDKRERKERGGKV